MKYYTCKYCFNEFEPKRRRVQIYCSNTCRAKAYHARKTGSTQLAKTLHPDSGALVPDLITPPSKTKIESVSIAGVGNATIGALAASGIKSVFTHPDNKAATKGDLKDLAMTFTRRYHLVNNLPKRDTDGALAYFDMETQEIIYSIYPL